ncbi:alpha/beta fold hydrolase [Agromyces sp. NPDC004153]
MRTVRVDGLDLAYRRSGHGVPLLFLHGAFGDSRDWTAESERLADRADVVAWDAPGCGGSSDVPEGWTDEDWSGAIAGFVDTLGLDRPVICGLSLGSVLALLAVRDHPRLARGLILAGPYAGWAGSLPATEVERRIHDFEATADLPVAEWAEEFLQGAFRADASPERLASARAALLEWRPQTTAAMLEALGRLDLRSCLHLIDVPTLVVHGGADRRSPFSAALAIAQAIPNARLVELAGLGHDCCGEAEFIRAVERFLDDLGDEAAA